MAQLLLFGLFHFAPSTSATSKLPTMPNPTPPSTSAASSTPPLNLFLDALASRGRRIKGVSGGQIMAQCPCHDDQTESLSIKEADDGRVLLHCFAGCEPADICKSVGWTLAQLFPDGRVPADGVMVTERAYRICDYDGNLIALHHRQDQSDGAKKMWWSRNGKNGLGGLSVNDLPLYGTELLKTETTAVVIVTEGEKAADAVRRFGLLGLGTVTGAGKTTAKCPCQKSLQVLKDRDVILWPDDDDIGRQHMILVQRGLDGVAKSVRRFDLKGPTPKCDAADFTGTREELIALLEIAPQIPATAPAQGGVIIVDHNIERVTDEGLAAVAKANPDALYQRAGDLVVVRADGSADHPAISQVKPPRLREIFAMSADWQQVNSAGQATKIMPPQWVVDTALARPTWRWLRRLVGISEIPVLRGDGVVVQTPGYDPVSGVLYRPVGGTADRFGTIDDQPTETDAKAAYAAIIDPMVDFVFRDDAARAAAVAAVLTIVGRHAIDGPTPLFHFGAPTRGAGKTMLANVCGVIATGRHPSMMTAARDDSELRKEILAVGIAGRSCVLIDNLEGDYGSATMAAVLTSPDGYEGRILGRTETVKVPMRTVWFSSGNNTQWNGDVSRRVVPIEQDPHVENPEERTGFRYSPLLPAVHEMHPRLVVAALTMLRAHAAAGHPDLVEAHMGSFESWDRVVRSAVIFASGHDPCAGRKALTEAADSELQDIGQVLSAWQAAFAITNNGVGTVAAAINRAQQHAASVRDGRHTLPIEAALCDALRSISPKGDYSNARSIGRWIQLRAGRIVGGKRFVREQGRNVAAWRVVDA